LLRDKVHRHTRGPGSITFPATKKREKRGFVKGKSEEKRKKKGEKF